jgi:hypothetical protein
MLVCRGKRFSRRPRRLSWVVCRGRTHHVTVAVCLECGKMKSGAWTPCPACSYQPRGIEELAKALMVSDNCIAPDTLAQFAARRQQGEPWNFGPELLEMFKQRVAAIITLTADGLPAPMGDGWVSGQAPQRGNDSSPPPSKT